MSGMGSAVMGTGEASGERRATLAAEEAVANPLLDEVSLKGAKGLLLSITGGRDLTLYEVDEAASRVRQEVDSDANIIVGATFDETLGDRVRVSIVASGMAKMEDTAPAASPSELRMRAQKAVAAPAGAQKAGYQGNAPDDNLARRLSEAIGHGEEPPAPDATEVGASGGTSREGWRAPGDVVIEEGFSHLTWLAQSARSRAQEGDTGDDASEDFKPAPPTDIRRGARRMPEVEDFPPLAQREYRAKSGYGADVPPRAPGASASTLDEPARLSIFQRIMGRTRHGEDSEMDDSSNRIFNKAPRESHAPTADEGWWDEDSASTSGDAPAEQPPPVPAFFNRLRK
jgi:cell division protein FtsZ